MLNTRCPDFNVNNPVDAAISIVMKLVVMMEVIARVLEVFRTSKLIALKIGLQKLEMISVIISCDVGLFLLHIC